MESGKPNLLKNFLVRLLLFGVLVIGVRFAYVVTVTGESCNVGDFCFFSFAGEFELCYVRHRRWFFCYILERRRFCSVDHCGGDGIHLISHGYLSPESKSLCVETPKGQDVFALKEIGVSDSVGIFKKASKPLVINGEAHRIPFGDNTFDFVFSGGGRLEKSPRPLDFASEIVRTLKPEGYAVVHIGAKDTHGIKKNSHDDENGDKCLVPGYKQDLVRKAEPLIMEEPLKPWLTLKRNIQNQGAMGSSIGSWFRKQYPKQNKTFEVYAIEADKTFHEEYKKKKAVTLLPYAAWVKNETLSFEINRDAGDKVTDKGRGMGFDFANWLKNTVTEKDFVVMKMDVEGLNSILSRDGRGVVLVRGVKNMRKHMVNAWSFYRAKTKWGSCSSMVVIGNSYYLPYT
ncbi:hypothetical protein F8388_022102 [Cannabis sativa]|uniref:Methyltransferase type 11 domain-containing protein n=1 Tax=Cannabis sativa TaxID=3483 RepID=A0A7J6G7R0_CANSA|nr:hypothetical protein F8388_022102 [Cannabis sativa]